MRTTDSEVVILDPCFGDERAEAMVDLCERLGRYRMYAELEQLETEIGRGLMQRHDSVQHFLRTGGRTGAEEPLKVLAARTSYFREEYAYGREPHVAGIEPFLDHDAFVEAARRVHGRPVVEPAIVYANLMVPGQELAVHTDVPEFRGLNRKLVPQWLLVVMHHSGLFDDWRMPIATGVAWFHDCEGGALAYWPDGPDAAPATHTVAFDTAMVLDTDSVFHGVDRIAEVAPDAMPRLRPGQTLDYLGRGASGAREWAVRTPDGDEVARYRWEELRFSVSWKAYCFRDEAERDTWREHRDDLTIDDVLDRLVTDLRDRGVVHGEPARDRDLGLLLIDEYVRFPTSQIRSRS